MNDASAARVAHVSRDLLGEMKETSNVGVEYLVPTVEGVVEDRGSPDHARIVDEDIDGTVHTERTLDESVDRIRLGDIDFQRRRATRVSTQLFCDDATGVDLARGNDHVGAGFGEMPDEAFRQRMAAYIESI